MTTREWKILGAYGVVILILAVADALSAKRVIVVTAVAVLLLSARRIGAFVQDITRGV
jgi:hypothetical protein